MTLSTIPARQVTPGQALTLKPPGAADPTTVRWHQVGGPAVPWAMDTMGNCTVTIPENLPGGATIIMRAEEGWLPLPTPGLATGSERVDYFSGGCFQVDEAIRCDGSRTLKVVPTAEYDGESVTVPVTAGRPYEFTTQVTSQTSTPGSQVKLTVIWKDVNRRQLNYGSSVSVAPPNGIWARLTYTATAPSGAAYATIMPTHFNLSNPQPYWLGSILAKVTDRALVTKDAVLSVTSATTRLTTTGDTSLGQPQPGYLSLDAYPDGSVGGPIIGGVTWRAHREGPGTSKLEIYRDISTPGRFKFVVGETTMPSSGWVQRAELGGKLYPFKRGTTYWWSFAFRMTGNPPSQAGGWMNVCQVHQTPDAVDTEGPQPLGLYWQQSGRLVLDRRYDPSTTTTSASYKAVESLVATTLTTGVWHRVVLRIRMDNGATSTGSLGMWYDGTSVVDAKAVPFGYNDVAENYPKFGIYRGLGAGINTCEYANMEIGTADLASRISNPLPVA